MKEWMWLSVLAGLYCYQAFVLMDICPGWKKNGVFLILAFAVIFGGIYWEKYILAVLVLIGMAMLFGVFYGDKPIRKYWWQQLILGGMILAPVILNGLPESGMAALSLFGFAFYLFASGKRSYLRLRDLFFVGAGYLGLWAGSVWMGEEIFFAIGALLLFAMLENFLSYYDRAYRTRYSQLQDEILTRQFSEIRDIYLNMRGWRHDYHNHIQVLKAYLDQGKPDKAREYLGQIEHELDKVDTFVKSGNMMADAILNSKLTMAMNLKIQVTCDAYLPQDLFLSDVDLCTILGNLLDNGLESCEKLPQEQRFLRIYLAMVKQQFYLSVQNSGKQIMDFNQENFITTKRGNHGLGLKRVAVAVDKWNGYLNVNQEPGVFGAEVSIPEPAAFREK